MCVYVCVMNNKTNSLHLVAYRYSAVTFTVIVIYKSKEKRKIEYIREFIIIMNVCFGTSSID